MIAYKFLSSTGELQVGDIAAINRLLAALTTRRVEATRESIAQVLYRAQLLVARDISAEDASPIIGMGTMNLISTVKGSWGYINDVVVLPSHEGRGIGTEMVRRLIEQARNLGLCYVQLTSSRGGHRARAHHVYKDKLGGTLRDTNVYRWTFYEPDAG